MTVGNATAGAATVPLTLDGPGLVASPASGALTSPSGINTYAGPLSVGTSGAATIVSSSTANADQLTLAGGVNIAAGKTLTFAGAGTTVISSPLPGTTGLSGAGNLTMSGTGTLRVAASSTFSGTANLNSGTTVLGALNGLGSGTVVLNNGTLRVAAASVAISGFGGSGTDWTVNSSGIATAPFPSPNLLQLTDGNGSEARSAFYNAPLPIASGASGFTATFNYTATAGADGTTLILQNDPRGVNALGDAGGSFGYGGAAAITPSVAVQLNIYGASYTGLGIDGSLSAFNLVPVNLSDGDAIAVTVSYDPTAHAVSEMLVDSTAGTNYSMTYTGIDLASLLGGNTAYVGFSGGTGGVASTQQVSNFNYSVQPGSTTTYGNDVVLAAGSTSTIDLAATAATSAFTLGTLTVNSGGDTTLDVSATTAPSNQAFALTLGATTLDSNLIVHVANNGTGTGTLRLGAVSDNFAGFGITKNGPGTLALTGAGSYSGLTIVNQGSLAVTHMAVAGGNPLGTSAVRLVGGTLALLPSSGQSTVAATGYNQDVVWARPRPAR